MKIASPSGTPKGLDAGSVQIPDNLSSIATGLPHLFDMSEAARPLLSDDDSGSMDFSPAVECIELLAGPFAEAHSPDLDHVSLSVPAGPGGRAPETDSEAALSTAHIQLLPAFDVPSLSRITDEEIILDRSDLSVAETHDCGSVPEAGRAYDELVRNEDNRGFATATEDRMEDVSYEDDSSSSPYHVSSPPPVFSSPVHTPMGSLPSSSPPSQPLELEEEQCGDVPPVTCVSRAPSNQPIIMEAVDIKFYDNQEVKETVSDVVVEP